MSRNPNIKAEHIAAILNLIRSWTDEKITWTAVCEAAKPVLGFEPSRSGLNSHPRLLEAFQARKAGLKVRPPEKGSMPGSLASAGRQIATKDAEIAELNSAINKLEERLVRWQYNALLRRVTPEQLDEPLPRIDRI